jgi:serine/threonine protein kinase
VTKLSKPLSFETAFGVYRVDEILGEGGAGRVYGGGDLDGMPIAIKVLAQERATADKRRRFKNEIAFLARNKHPNIVTLFDHGIATTGEILGPFYVMRRYESSLRHLMEEQILPARVLPLFSQILDGVEAAHLKNAVHRDLKPENILFDSASKTLAIADFGTARFTEDLLATTVETGPSQRLANFQYAAPEQRAPGKLVVATADIFALGLILNEMFTGAVPQGTEYRVIGHVAKEQGFLDAIVASMIRQAPEERPGSIAEVKRLIQRHHSDAVSLQKLSQIEGTVIKANEIDEPLAVTPPRLVGADWNGGVLTLTLDRAVTPKWIEALHQMGSFTSVLGKPPQVFNFRGNQAVVGAPEHEVQSLIDNFKAWLPTATRTLKFQLEQDAQRQHIARLEQLRREQEAEEQRLRIMRKIQI